MFCYFCYNSVNTIYYERNLEELVNRSQIKIQTMVNAFKDGENENTLVIEIRELLNKLPNSKNDIETKLKSYEMIDEREEDFPYFGDMLLVDE